MKQFGFVKKLIAVLEESQTLGHLGNNVVHNLQCFYKFHYLARWASTCCHLLED